VVQELIRRGEEVVYVIADYDESFSTVSGRDSLIRIFIPVNNLTENGK